MEWRIERCSSSPTVVFAAEELAKYLCKMSSGLEVAILKSKPDRQIGNAIQLQIGGAGLPAVVNPLLDDAYFIHIENQSGVIIGSNARSVLLGVYRYLRELGCRFLRPGEQGEIIPLADCTALCAVKVKISEAASYRHRGVCIEGSTSYRHVKNMIDWLPKIGMNGYFNQFSTPYCFFDYWYQHKNNPYMDTQPTSFAEVTAMVEALTEQVNKRGMMYHATGHGWTCDPVGIPGSSWEKEEFNITGEQRELLAMVDGKREVFEGIALNTNLCYSNPIAQDKIVTAISDYCEARKEVDYLHFWLADAPNNHCECENCRDVLPADFYVKILNDIDKRLTAKNIPTKIVFLIYFDLLWEPQTERLVNQERFTLMFAPITRTYSKAFCEDNDGAPVTLKPYERNKLEMPNSVGENIARLNRWQAQFSGDSFDFDYHLIWDHNHDLGGYESARILFEDMKNLDKLNLNGMMSCQVQRAFFPTSFMMNAMAAALWDKNQSFEAVAGKYYADMFGEYADEMRGYFKKLSELFQPSYMRGEKEYVCEESEKLFAEIPKVVSEMLPKLYARYEQDSDPCMRLTWQTLTIHAQLCIYLAEAMVRKASGNQAEADAKWDFVVDYVNRMEPLVQDLFDVKYFSDVIGRTIKGELHFG